MEGVWSELKQFYQRGKGDSLNSFTQAHANLELTLCVTLHMTAEFYLEEIRMPYTQAALDATLTTYPL